MNAAAFLTEFAGAVAAHAIAVRRECRSIYAASDLIARFAPQGVTMFEDAVHVEAKRRALDAGWRERLTRRAS